MGFRTRIAVAFGLAGLTLFLVRAHARQNSEEEKEIVITQKIATSSFFGAAFSLDTTSKSSANMAIYSGEGSMGPFTGQGVSQSEQVPGSKFGDCTLPPDKDNPKEPPAQGIPLRLVGHIASSKIVKTGDLLFERGGLGALTACLDPVTLIFHETGTVKIVGGTGAFCGADGEEEVVQDGQIFTDPTHFPNASANGAFGFSKGHFTARFKINKSVAEKTATCS